MRWSLQQTKYNGRRGKNARDLPDLIRAVQRWRVFLGPMHLCLVSCMDLRAFRVDVLHNVEAIAGDILEEARVHGTETYRGARTASTEDRLDLKRLCLDLQAHPR